MCMETNFISPQKITLRKIKVSDIGSSLPDLKNAVESKSITIAKWLISWIEKSLQENIIEANDLLPAKNDLAYMLGVSAGTIQNSLRYLEDCGYVESKQRIGTIIKDRFAQNVKMRKLTSKREIAIVEIKKFIIHNRLKVGEFLPSSRTMSELTGCSSNTARLALEYLCTCGILEHQAKSSKEPAWKVKSIDFEHNFAKESISHTTLVKKVELELKKYINDNMQIGEKLPAHSELAETLKVSIKTVHDALKVLINEGILLPRRGRYGTTVIRLPKETENSEKMETSIFAPAKDTAFYYYEKTQNAIKNLIAENYEIGSKLPSILELSKEMDLSPNTIRKAFHNLAKEGYLVFSRGRYGGTFVIDIPETGSETFKWLAVNPKYAEIYNN